MLHATSHVHKTSLSPTEAHPTLRPLLLRLSGLVQDARFRMEPNCLAVLLVMLLAHTAASRLGCKVVLMGGRAPSVGKRACRTTSGVVASVEVSKPRARLRSLGYYCYSFHGLIRIYYTLLALYLRCCILYNLTSCSAPCCTPKMRSPSSSVEMFCTSNRRSTRENREPKRRSRD